VTNQLSARVRLRDWCYSSPLGLLDSEVLECFQTGRSGVVDVTDFLAEQSVLKTGALLPALKWEGQDIFHPRLSARYQGHLHNFTQRLAQMLQSQQLEKVYLICKRPFYSEWASTACSPVEEAAFVAKLFERAGISEHQRTAVQLQAACSSGVLALNWACQDLLDLPVNKRVLILAIETELNAEKFIPFKKLGALSQQQDPRWSCLPFSEKRSGLVPGEVLSAICLESVADSALESGDIVMEMGHTNCDASRLTDGLESGDYLRECLERSWPKDGADFICPHATSTPLNDALEGKVLEEFLRDRGIRIPVVPLKQYIGHTLNSSGVWETILMTLLLKNNLLPPLLSPPDPRFQLELLESVRCKPLQRAVKLSIGFGGLNSALSLHKVP
jgi:3-oxoacyl-(acyl-carrier-protein) synthase